MNKLILVLGICLSALAHSQISVSKNEGREARQRLINLFNASNTPATLSDFTGAMSLKEARCMTFPYYQDRITSHPVWFKKAELLLSQPTPLFPSGLSQITLQSSFKNKNVSEVNAPGENIITNEPTSLNVKTWGDITIPGEEFNQSMWMIYNFRKYEGYIVFTIDFVRYLNTSIDPTKTSYGYCW